MSIKIMSKVWDLDTESATEKLVLLALADNSNDAGVCWPSIPTLAKKSGLSESTVRSHIRTLETKGWMTTKNSSGTSNTYTLNIPYTPPDTGGPPALGAPPTDVGVPHREAVPTPPAAGAKPSENRQLNHHKSTCASRFEKPSIEAIKLQCSKIGLPEDQAEAFLNYYEANGWRVGRNPMRSWPHALSMWKSKYEQFKANGYTKTQQPRINQRNAGCSKPTTDVGAAAAKRSVLAQMAKPENRSLL